jgi:hypothetical protein
VTISVWVEGKVTELQDSLMRQANLGVDHLGRSAHALLVNVTVGLGTLDPQTRKLLQGLKVSTQQAAHWVRTSLPGCAVSPPAANCCWPLAASTLPATHEEEH